MSVSKINMFFFNTGNTKTKSTTTTTTTTTSTKSLNLIKHSLCNMNFSELSTSKACGSCSGR